MTRFVGVDGKTGGRRVSEVSDGWPCTDLGRPGRREASEVG